MQSSGGEARCPYNHLPAPGRRGKTKRGHSGAVFVRDWREIDRIMKVDFNTLTRYQRFSGLPRDAPGAAEFLAAGNDNLLHLNDDRHTRIKAIVTECFSQKNIRQHKPFVERVVNDILDRVEATNYVDILGDVAVHVPTIIVNRILGVDMRHTEHIRHLLERMSTYVFHLGHLPDLFETASTAATELRQLVLRFLYHYREHPADNVMSTIARADMTDDEAAQTLVVFFQGAYDTTIYLIASAVMLLMDNRSQWDLLVANPDLAERAVHETLRLESPVPLVNRVSPGMVIDGIETARGDIVNIDIQAFHRDPTRVDRPDEFDIMRPMGPLVAFAQGKHMCPGRFLGRMEANTVLRALCTRFPNMRLQDGFVPRRIKMDGFMGPTCVNVVLDPSRTRAKL